jgi:NTE family protein
MIRRALRMPKGPRRKAALMLGLLPRGMVSTRPLEHSIRRIVPHGWVEHPGLRITAMDYATGELTIFGEPDAPHVDVATAVTASCSFPPFFHPVKIDGRRFVDGGLRSPSNLDLLADQGFDLVVCLNPLSFPERPGPPPRRWRARMAESLRANARRCVAREAEKLRAGGTDVVIVQPTEEDRAVMGDNMMSRRNRSEVAELAVRTVGEQLARQSDLLTGLPEGEPHKVARPEGPPAEWPAFLPPNPDMHSGDGAERRREAAA